MMLRDLRFINFCEKFSGIVYIVYPSSSETLILKPLFMMQECTVVSDSLQWRRLFYLSFDCYQAFFDLEIYK